MNDRPDDVLLEPTDERMSEIRDGIFHDVIAARNAERAYNRERSRAGWWVGGIGAAIGVLACGALTAVAIYAKPVRIYTVIDSAAGVIYDSYGAQDARRTLATALSTITWPSMSGCVSGLYGNSTRRLIIASRSCRRLTSRSAIRPIATRPTRRCCTA